MESSNILLYESSGALDLQNKTVCYITVTPENAINTVVSVYDDTGVNAPTLVTQISIPTTNGTKQIELNYKFRKAGYLQINAGGTPKVFFHVK